MLKKIKNEIKEIKNKNISACKKNIYFLKYIHSIPIKKRNTLIKKYCSNNELKAIIEIFLNFLHKNIQCKTSFIKMLKKYSNYFHRITKKSFALSKKRKILTSKTGGFLLSSLLNLAIPLISKIFLKAK